VLFSKTRLTLFILAALIGIAALYWGFSLLAGPLLRVENGRRLGLDDFLSQIGPHQIILVGEQHDNRHHHAHQLALIRELHEKAERPMAIGLEMFEAGDQQVLDAWTGGKITLKQFVTAYSRNWSIDWELYQDIFLYAREHKIPLIGLNAPRRIVQKVWQKGFAALNQQDLEQLPGQITCDVDGAYEAFIGKVYEWHGGRNFSFRSFCEAQMLWDTTMAINLLQFHARQPDYTIVVLAGNGHCWKPAIPRQIRRRSDVPLSVILPETVKQNRFSVGTEDADYLWLYNFLAL
jgi:uncharacterized iron-regulated protein